MNNLPVALIPAYKPSRELSGIVSSLICSGVFQAVVCVDDGSGPEYGHIFQELESLGVNVLCHSTNMGKGAALQTGFREIASSYKDSGAVTLDADGQHLSKDVMQIASVLMKNNKCLVLGSRSFDGDKVPGRSRFGNTLTKWVFSFLTGIKISDTQTGLRGVPAQMITPLLLLKTKGYDFELDMLIFAKDLGVKIIEEPITTVYENGNSTSHFNPLLDSFRIYFVFLRYAWVGFLSFALDFIMFMAFVNIFRLPVAGANVAARGVSSTFNFILNRNVVFKSKGNIYKEYAKYFTLMVSIILFNTGIVYFTYHNITKFSPVAKLAAEGITFLITFVISRKFIFKNK